MPDLYPSYAAVWMQCPAAAQFIQEAGREKAKPSEDAAKGTKAHAVVESYMNTGKAPETPDE